MVTEVSAYQETVLPEEILASCRLELAKVEDPHPNDEQSKERLIASLEINANLEAAEGWQKQLADEVRKASGSETATSDGSLASTLLGKRQLLSEEDRGLLILTTVARFPLPIDMVEGIDRWQKLALLKTVRHQPTALQTITDRLRTNSGNKIQVVQAKANTLGFLDYKKKSLLEAVIKKGMDETAEEISAYTALWGETPDDLGTQKQAEEAKIIAGITRHLSPFLIKKTKARLNHLTQFLSENDPDNLINAVAVATTRLAEIEKEHALPPVEVVDYETMPHLRKDRTTYGKFIQQLADALEWGPQSSSVVTVDYEINREFSRKLPSIFAGNEGRQLGRCLRNLCLPEDIESLPSIPRIIPLKTIIALLESFDDPDNLMLEQAKRWCHDKREIHPEHLDQDTGLRIEKMWLSKPESQ